MLVGFYVIPAIVIALCIWLGMASLKNFGLGVGGRRIALVALATIGLAPAIAPAGIAIVYVPYGMFVAHGDLPMLHQPRLVNFAALSFVGTAVVFAMLSFLFVRKTADASPAIGKARLAGVAQVMAIALVVSAYRAALPDREVDDSIDWALVETLYGEQLDRVEALTQVTDADAWRAEVAALRDRVEADPTIRHLDTFHDSFEQYQQDRRLSLGARHVSGSCSSSGGTWRDDKLMRCSRRYGDRGKTETLLYRRMSFHGGDRTYIDIEFDYDELVERANSRAARAALAGSDTLARRHDKAVLGRWSITSRFARTADDERVYSGTMTIGPRLSFGTYAVEIDAEVNATLRDDDSTFARPECSQQRESCTFNQAVTGTVRIVGDKVQIIYDARGWRTNILSLDGDEMIGPGADGGAVARFRRAPKSPIREGSRTST